MATRNLRQREARRDPCKFPDYIQNHYATHPEDMPDQFNYPLRDDERIKKRAYAIGIYTGEVIDRIFAGVKIKGQ